MQQMTMREYAEAILKNYGPYAKVSWLNVTELIEVLDKLDLLERELKQIEMEKDGYETPMQIRASLGL